MDPANLERLLQNPHFGREHHEIARSRPNRAALSHSNGFIRNEIVL